VSLKYKLLYGLVWFFGWVYRFTIQVLWNVVFNLAWALWFLVTGRWPQILRTAKMIEKRIKSAADAMIEYRKFTYMYDGLSTNITGFLSFLNKYPTWTAHPLILIGRGLRGNCMDAVAYIKWLLRMAPNEYGGRTRIYVPIKPFRLDKVHYFYSIGKYMQLSNGKVSTETDHDLALRYLNDRNAVVVFL